MIRDGLTYDILYFPFYLFIIIIVIVGIIGVFQVLASHLGALKQDLCA